MKKIIFILGLLTSQMVMHGQSMWQFQNNAIETFGKRVLVPQEFKLVFLQHDAFKALNIPNIETGKKIKFSLPNPNGEMVEFYIAEAPAMENGLAIKFPTIKTYTAIQVNNPSIVGKLDFTDFGFHAMIQDNENTWFIDPYTNVNTGYYSVYYKKNYVKPLNERMKCDVEELVNEEIKEITKAQYKTHGTEKRAYRIAIACTGEYAYAVAGPNPTTSAVISAITTSVNRVSGVYEKELGMEFNLIANNNLIVFLDSINDGFTNDDDVALIAESQSTISSIIGSANYDIGHTFSTGGGGLASLGVCQNNSKASGITGSPNPKGDPFDIDYVCHEIGHQFSAAHTFESETGSCNGNRSTSSAFEVGGGTTIMGYAGICDVNDLQNNSDAYFCLRSLDQIRTYTLGTSHTCPVKTPTNNTPPVIPVVKKTFYIPDLIYFDMNAKGTDANNHPINYCWEEYDRTGSSTGTNFATPTLKAPMFRSFFGKADTFRSFPRSISIYNNLYTNTGERAAGEARNMYFRLVARDVDANGFGSFNLSDDSVSVIVKKLPSLFRVTSQATATTYSGAQSVTVTWDVAGTNTDAQINAQNVDIWFSTNQCATFDYLMASNVPNNGSATAILPNVSTTKGRIKVKAKDNIFFDTNNGNITINPVNWPASIANIDLENITIAPNPARNNLKISGLKEAVNLQIVNTLGIIVLNKKVSNNSLVDIQHLPTGIYYAKFTNNNFESVSKKIFVY